MSASVAVVRPPGHHAECQRAMGFCFYNNVAAAAQAALQHPGVGSVGREGCGKVMGHGMTVHKISSSHGFGPACPAAHVLATVKRVLVLMQDQGARL